MKTVKAAAGGIMCGVLVLTLVVLMIPVKITTIVSGSMYPTLETGDTVLISTKAKVVRGSVIAFSKLFYEDGEEFEQFLAKRVVGMSGDRIEADGEGLYVNDTRICECEGVFEYDVPDDKLFVVGDNSTNSFDSREWDDPFVRTSRVLGVITHKLWSFETVE